MCRKYLVLSILLFATTGSSLANDKGPDLACIDQVGDKNGKINTDQEILALALHQDKVFREQDKNCDGEITKAELDTWFRERKNSLRVKLAVNDIKRRVSAGAGPKIERKKEREKEERQPKEQLSWAQPKDSGQFRLRRDFKDFHTFSSPRPEGNGADFGITWDKETNNRSVSAKGVAFIPFIFNHSWDESQRNSPYIASVAFAPSLRFEYLSNSSTALKKKNIEILTPGLTAEAEIGNLLNLSHFFRARASLVTNMGQLDSWQVRGEWQPIEPAGHVCIGTPCTFFGSPILFRFDPVLVAEYAGALEGSALASKPLFVDSDRALRLGPSLALKMYANALRRDELPVWLQYAEFRAAYTWYADVLSDRHYSLLDLVLTLRSDKDDRIGLSFSYTRGQTEDTAQHVDVAKAGLSVKF